MIAGTRLQRHRRLTHRGTHRPTTGTPTGRDVSKCHCMGEHFKLHLTFIF